jgi:hypothetical protein
VGEQNIGATAEEIQEAIDFAVESGKDVRLHERGDFLLDNKIDREYVNNWQSVLTATRNLPWIWGYTHVFQVSIAKLRQKRVNLYASVHSTKDIKQAKKKGFKLFAWQIDTPKKRGGSKNFPAKLDMPILGRTLVCPEQRLGRNNITCDKCRWCIEGKGHVIFLKSS